MENRFPLEAARGEHIPPDEFITLVDNSTNETRFKRMSRGVFTSNRKNARYSFNKIRSCLLSRIRRECSKSNHEIKEYHTTLLIKTLKNSREDFFPLTNYIH